MSVADVVLSNWGGCASSLGRERIGSLHGLCCGPFGGSHKRAFGASCHVRYRGHSEDEACCLSKAKLDCLRTLGSPPSGIVAPPKESIIRSLSPCNLFIPEGSYAVFL
jgi:hypothetical protein